MLTIYFPYDDPKKLRPNYVSFYDMELQRVIVTVKGVKYFNYMKDNWCLFDKAGFTIDFEAARQSNETVEIQPSEELLNFVKLDEEIRKQINTNQGQECCWSFDWRRDDSNEGFTAMTFATRHVDFFKVDPDTKQCSKVSTTAHAGVAGGYRDYLFTKIMEEFL